MAKENNALKLGKGATFFVKSRLKRLPKQDETWEADFRALPKPIMRTETHYIGMVVVQPHGDYLAELQVKGRPSVNDLATLLAQAMRRPFTEGSHRPRRILVRKNPRWQELFAHLEQIGVEVVVQSDLPTIKQRYQDYLRHLREAGRAKMVRPTELQASVEQLFPAIAQWIRGYGHIEIGDQETFGFVVRAIDYGGVVFEDDKPTTLAEALAALEKGLTEYFEREGIEID